MITAAGEGTIRVSINGRERETAEGTSVAEIVATVSPQAGLVAAELNAEIVPRGDWESTLLQEGDRLEIVRFVQGG